MLKYVIHAFKTEISGWLFLLAPPLAVLREVMSEVQCQHITILMPSLHFSDILHLLSSDECDVGTDRLDQIGYFMSQINQCVFQK